MTAEERLTEVGIDIPPAPPAVAAYVPWVRTGSLVMTSGQLPWENGVMRYAGKIGAELNEEQGYEAARLSAINAIAQLKQATGDLEKIRQIVRIEGNVHAAPGFHGHPLVLNGASEFINQVFGDRGRHTRTAVGTSEMPLNAAVQISVFAEVID